MSLRLLIAIGLATYGLLMLGVALFSMTRIRKTTDFLLAGRGLPFWVLIGTFVGTGVGTGATVGASGLAYRSGWAGCVYPIGLGVGIVLVGLFFSKMRRYRFMTLSEEVASYYGGDKIIYEYSNVGLFLSQIFWLTVQIMGGAFILSVVTGLRPGLCMVIAGILAAVASVPGGLVTVVYTDVLQAAILIVGFTCLTYISLQESGGLAGLQQMVPPAYFSLLGSAAIGWRRVISIGSALVIAVIADPGRRLAMYAARTEAGAKWSMVVSGIIEIVFSAAVGITGMYAFSLNPNIQAQDQALPWLVMNVLPKWLAAVVVVSIAAAVFSSANTNAAAAGTYFVRHVYPLVTGRYPKRPVPMVRWALICVFLISTAFALYAGTIVDFVVNFLSVTMSGLAVIILVGRFWKRATRQGGIAGLVSALLVSLTVIFVPGQKEIWLDPMIPATLAGFLAVVVVSLLTPAEKTAFDEVAASMTRERHDIDS